MNKVKKSKNEPIIIIGGQMKGYAGEAVQMLEDIGGYDVVGFLDNSPEFEDKYIDGVPVLGLTDNLEVLKLSTKNFYIAIGDNFARGDIFKKLKALGSNIVTLVHPQAIIRKSVVIGEGSYIGPGVIIDNDVKIGEACIIESGCIIQKNCKIGHAVYLSAGAKAGSRARIEDHSFVGLGSTILPDIQIGTGVMIDADSRVDKNVPSGITMRGYSEKSYPKKIYMDVEPDVSPSRNIYVAQPTMPDYPLLDAKFKSIVDSRMLSNFARYSKQLELNIQGLLSVKGALTFPNGTSALMLALRILNLSGEVILPSFTFSATGHAVLWNGLTPVFADIDPQTFNIDPDDVERKITDKTSAIIGVHIFGNPCDVDRLEGIANRHNLRLIFDSAHALGSKYNGTIIGCFGDVECFSLSGTKVITSGEGGIATSNDEAFIEKLKLGRNYGAGDDYNCVYLGMNGKMSEFHAAIAIESLLLLPDLMRARNDFAALYRKRLSEIPGITFQHVPQEHVSTYKDFGIIIDKEILGLDRDELIAEVNKEGIFPKRYFFPPLHLMPVYRDMSSPTDNLGNTLYIANNIVCLPIYSHMQVDTIEKICYTIYRIWRNKDKRN